MTCRDLLLQTESWQQLRPPARRSNKKITKETIAAKSRELPSHIERLTGLLTQAIEDAAPLHEFEEKTFRVLLGLGPTCLKILVNALGTGDVEEAAILVHTADGKGPPIRRRPSETPLIESDRSNSGAQPNRKKMAVLGAIYSIEPHLPTPEDVIESRFRYPDQPDKKTTRPRPQHKRVHANWDPIGVPGDSVHGPAATCGWIAEEVASQKPHSTKPVVAIMDGQESLWNHRDIYRRYPNRSSLSQFGWTLAP